MLSELDMVRVEVPATRSLNAKYYLKAAERNPKWGDYGISPIDNACNMPLPHSHKSYSLGSHHAELPWGTLTGKLMQGLCEPHPALIELVRAGPGKLIELVRAGPGKLDPACENTLQVSQMVA